MTDLLLPPGARPIPNQPDEPALPLARPGTSPVHDPEAEQGVAACAALARHAADTIAAALDPTDFYDPRCAAVVHAATTIQATAPEGEDDMWWREHAVAHAAGIDPTLLEQWAREAPVAHDTSGALTRRVKAMAARRARIHQLLAELDELGIHSRWDL